MLNKSVMNFIGCDAGYEEADIVLYGAPFDSTTSFRPGTRFAGQAVRNDSYGLETYSPYQDRDLEDCRIFDLGDLELDNAVYTFSAEGALTGASWKENTGGGAYFAGCYDTQEQILFEYLCDEKQDQYFDARPDREQEYDGDMHTSYDRYAGFKMDVKLNRIAAARLKEAMENGYADEKNSTYKELYIRNCEDGEAAFDKIMDLLEKQYSRGEAYQDTLDYYRYLGMAHYEADGRHWFMVVLKR